MGGGDNAGSALVATGRDFLAELGSQLRVALHVHSPVPDVLILPNPVVAAGHREAPGGQRLQGRQAVGMDLSRVHQHVHLGAQ